MREDHIKQLDFDNLPDVDVHYTSFGERLREIRREHGLTQDEFAAILGTSKQILSRYELEQRSPKIEQVKKYAEKLQVSVDYLLGDTESEAVFNTICLNKKRKPFYKIFIDVTVEMGIVEKIDGHRIYFEDGKCFYMDTNNIAFLCVKGNGDIVEGDGTGDFTGQEICYVLTGATTPAYEIETVFYTE